MRLFMHHPGSETVTIHEDVDPEKPLAEIVVLEEDELLWIEGRDEPVELHLTLVELDFEPTCHAVHGHKHTCREIHVKVTYIGTTKERSERPNSPLEALLDWAVKVFEIDPTAAADLGFRLVGSTTDLSLAEHVGSLTKGKACSVELELLPGDHNAG